VAPQENFHNVLKYITNPKKLNSINKINYTFAQHSENILLMKALKPRVRRFSFIIVVISIIT